MPENSELDEDELSYLDFLEDESRRREDREEAAKYIDRWIHVIREELQRMRSEGVDPYIAWLSVRIATDWWADDPLAKLRPDGSEC